MTPREILQRHWGYDGFRSIQEQIIDSVLSGHDTLGLMPTGGGKSITFQVPALALGGLTLVVTPLISLMKDQTDRLVRQGIRATAVYMGMTRKEIMETYERVIAHRYPLLYLSPERLGTSDLLAMLPHMDVRLLVVDEAHCISQWGYDFRPAYLRIADIRPVLDQGLEMRYGQNGVAGNPYLGPGQRHVTCLALTATATPAVAADICQRLRFRPGAQTVRASFARPALTYSVVHSEDKSGTLAHLLAPFATDETDLPAEAPATDRPTPPDGTAADAPTPDTASRETLSEALAAADGPDEPPTDMTGPTDEAGPAPEGTNAPEAAAGPVPSATATAEAAATTPEAESQTSGPGSAIVYVRSRQQTEEMALRLTSAGIAATFYHAGLPAMLKQQRQDQWMEGHPRVMVATNAFGMGIDKPDVRVVCHIDLPPSPEEYFQEAGRAGRDGQPAQAYLIVGSEDIRRAQRRLDMEFPDRDFIRMVYGRLASFFQIAIGAGLGALFEFDIYKYCSAYRLAAGPVNAALRMLHAAGYIAYLEEPDRHSRAIFTCSREHLYHTPGLDAECQRIIVAMLRLYTGLFADYVWVDEDQIARRAGLTRERLYDRLLLLGRMHILHYVPARQVPAIIYLTPRLENDEIRISHVIHEDRLAARQQRLDAMSHYAGQHEACRSTVLLRYFGEEAVGPCGHCDVCRSQMGQGLSPLEAEAALQAAIMSHIDARGPLTPQQVVCALADIDPERIAASLRTLAEEGQLTLSAGVLCRAHRD